MLCAAVNLFECKPYPEYRSKCDLCPLATLCKRGYAKGKECPEALSACKACPKWNRCTYGPFAPARRLSEHPTTGALEYASVAGPQRPTLLHVPGSPLDQTKAMRLAPLKPWLGRVLSRRASDTLEHEPILLLNNPTGTEGAPTRCDVTALGGISAVPTHQDIAAGLRKLAF